MRVLDVRDGHIAEDVESGRAVLQEAIDHPSNTVAIIRGSKPEVSSCAARIETRCEPFQWRVAIWVRDSRVFSEGQEAELFEGHDFDIFCAVVLNIENKRSAWIKSTATLFEIDRSLREVESGK